MTASSTPLPVRVVLLVALAEGIALVGYGLLVLVMAVRGDRASVGNAVLLAVLLAGWGLGLAAAGRAVATGRRQGRAPVVLSQIFGLLIGVPLAQGGALLVGGLVSVVAAVGLAAALAPQVTAWVLPNRSP